MIRLPKPGAGPIKGKMKKVIALVSEDFEDLELWYPVLRLREEGCRVDFAAEKAGKRIQTDIF